MKVDPKSLIIGLLLGLLIFTSLAAVKPDTSINNGRYTMHIENDRKYILDTQTGHLWHKRHSAYSYDYGIPQVPVYEKVNHKKPNI